MSGRQIIEPSPDHSSSHSRVCNLHALLKKGRQRGLMSRPAKSYYHPLQLFKYGPTKRLSRHFILGMKKKKKKKKNFFFFVGRAVSHFLFWLQASLSRCEERKFQNSKQRDIREYILSLLKQKDVELVLKMQISKPFENP